MSKAILILERIKECDVEDYTCPLWNKDKLRCQYRLNTKSKGRCPLKPLPQKKKDYEGLINHVDDYYEKGWNDCIDEILGGENE